MRSPAEADLTGAPGSARAVGVRGVIVDYGGVISRTPSAARLAKLRSLCGLDEGAFMSAWFEHRHAYDRGQLSAAEYWARVAGREHDEKHLEQIVAADVACWGETDPLVTGWLGDLKAAGFLVGVLSNMPREHWLAFAERHVWPPVCDVITLSWERGAAKPEEAIFSHCLASLGLRPDEALFVDDSPENIDAAAALGVRTVLYSGLANLRDELSRRYGSAFPVPKPLGEHQ